MTTGPEFLRRALLASTVDPSKYFSMSSAEANYANADVVPQKAIDPSQGRGNGTIPQTLEQAGAAFLRDAINRL